MSTGLYTGGLPSRSDIVYERLRRALLEGEIDLDARLTEPKVSAYFEVSRTPVREALARLCAAGLLVRRDYGFTPVRPTLSGVRDLYELRLAVELAGIRRAADNDQVVHDRSALMAERDRWLAIVDQPPAKQSDFVVVDEAFHLALLAAAGNAELVSALEGVNVRIRRVRMYDSMVNTRIETSIAEHLGILDALLAGHLVEAQARLGEHIGASLDVVISRVERALIAMDREEPSRSDIARGLR